VPATLLVELWAGSAALTRHLLGLGKLVGFQGSKDGYARAIATAWGCPRPDCVWLNDPGLWGSIWPALISEPRAVGGVIETWATDAARALWARARTSTAAGPELAAAKLCQLAGTYGGSEVGGFKGLHVRRPKVDGFIPSRETLARRASDVAISVPAIVTATDAGTVQVRGAWCYLDPPYRGTSGYRHQLSRERVVDVARRLSRAGNSVAVSEREPIPELIDSGWEAFDLTESRAGQRRRNTRSSTEWLMVSPDPFKREGRGLPTADPLSARKGCP
jgi:hypothetical protein